MQFGKIFVKRSNIEIRFAIGLGNIPLADVLYAILSPEIVQAGAVKGLVAVSYTHLTLPTSGRV